MRLIAAALLFPSLLLGQIMAPHPVKVSLEGSRPAPIHVVRCGA
jgi:hypothetical protein